MKLHNSILNFIIIIHVLQNEGKKMDKRDHPFSTYGKFFQKTNISYLLISKHIHAHVFFGKICIQVKCMIPKAEIFDEIGRID